jgi:hypothetical protein
MQYWLSLVTGKHPEDQRGGQTLSRKKWPALTIFYTLHSSMQILAWFQVNQSVNFPHNQ